MTPTYAIEIVSLDTIDEDPDNAFDHSDAEIARLTGSIQEYGFLEIVVINGKTGRLIGGKARCEASRSANLTHIPALIVNFEDVQASAAGIALNAPYGHFDIEKLTDDLRLLDDADWDLDLTGLEPWRIDELLHPPPKNKGSVTSDKDTERDITTTVRFDSEKQQECWFKFLKYLRLRYPDCVTIGERLHKYSSEVAG